MNDLKVNFICVGAEKAGTTWLANVLREHPDVFIPAKKEIHYFNKKFVEYPEIDNINHAKSIDWYHSFFRAAKENQLKGEICPSYLWDRIAAKKIQQYNPHMKIIIILRDPIKRVYSQFLYYRQKGVIKADNLLDGTKEREDLLYRSLYFRQVKRYVQLFPKKNCKVLLYERLSKDPRAFLFEVEDFLGIKRFVPANIGQKYNVTGEPIFKNLNVALAKARFYVRAKNLYPLIWLFRKTGIANIAEKIRNDLVKPYGKKPEMDAKTKSKLKQYFSKDVKQMEKLLGNELWR